MRGELFVTALVICYAYAKWENSSNPSQCEAIQRWLERKDCALGPQASDECKRKLYTFCKKNCTDTIGHHSICSEISGFKDNCSRLTNRWEKRNCTMKQMPDATRNIEGKPSRRCRQLYGKILDLGGCSVPTLAQTVTTTEAPTTVATTAETHTTEASKDSSDPKTVCESVSGFRFYESGDHPAMCLRAFPARLTYDQARAKCREQGARLVMPKTRATLDFLFNVLPNDVTGNGHWVGLDDRAVEGRFVWGDDGSVLPLDSDLWRQDRNAEHLAEHDARDCAHTYTSPQGVHSLSDTNCVVGARPAVCHLTDF